MKSSAARRRVHSMAVVLTALSVTVWYAVSRGQDFNFDQRLYHIGVPFLLSHGTFWSSIAPATITAYFNPYVLEAQYWLLQRTAPVEFAATLALCQSLSFILAGVICSDIAVPPRRWIGSIQAFLGFLLCLLAPVALSEAGTTFIDLVTSVPVLAAYMLLLSRGRRFGYAPSGALSGVLLGIATALKLTNGVFALGMVGFALAGTESLRTRVAWMSACTAAAMLAYLVVGGPWQLQLWSHFHNPIFPYYNSIFKSPDFPWVNYYDRRFAVHSVLDIWRYPLAWVRPWWHLGGRLDIATGLPIPSSELTFADPRWIVAVGGATLFVVALAVFWGWSHRRLADPATGLIFAFLIDYVVWIRQFDIHRYAITLDILCGAVILVLVTSFRSTVFRVSFLALAVVASWRMMQVPDWGHLPWKTHWQTIDQHTLDLGQRPIIFLTGAPSLYIAASLPESALYIGLYPGHDNLDLSATNRFPLTFQIERDISSRNYEGLWEVDRGATPALAVAVLASYGLAVRNECDILQIATDRFRICKVEHRLESYHSDQIPAPYR